MRSNSVFVAHGLWSVGGGLRLWFDEDGRPVDDPARLPAPPPDWSGPLQDALTPAELDARPTLYLPADDRLVAREVPAIALSAADASDLLLEIAYRRADNAGGWTLSPELRFLAEVASGIARWVYSGRVVPAQRGDGQDPRGGGSWRACWTLIDDGPIRAWCTHLQECLPPILRAQVVNGRTPSGAQVLADLVDVLADAIVVATLRLREPRAPSTAHPLLKALDTGDPVELAAAGAQELAAGLRRWAASSSLDGPDVLFRITEPPEDEPGTGAARWLLETCLRTADSAPVALGSLPRSARNDSLAMHVLGRAMTAYPPLRRHTPNVHEHVVRLSPAEVVDFVATGAPALRSAGITVLLPRAWTRLDPTLRLAVHSPAASAAVDAGAVGMDQVLGYQWRLALGEVTLSKAEMRRVATAKAPLVRLRDEWVQVEPTVLARAARYVAARTDTEATLGELLSVLTAEEPPVPVVDVQTDGWVGELASGAQLRSVRVPEGLRAQLRPYQQRGLDWLAFMSRLGLGVVLADDMGLGKTVQVIALLLHEQARAPTLVVCPMSVVGNWHREVERFAPQLRVLVHHGANRPRGESLHTLAGRADIVLTTYALLARDRAELAAVEWERVVLDEAQHVKNVSTAAARAARALPTRHRIAMTGTPVENRLTELRALLDFANPGMLGSAQSFRARFAVPIEREHDASAVTRLRTATAPFILRRVKTDPAVITDLPSKLEMTVRANLTVEQAALYQAVVEDMVAKIAQSHGAQRKALVLSTLTRLKQVCNHPAQFLADGSAVLRRGQHRSGKLELVQDVLHSVLGEGEKALLFTQFRQFGELLAPWLAEEFGVAVPFLHGGVSKGRRERMVEEFQVADGPPILLASLKAGGTGLNLTAANQVVHLDRWWNPAVENQATDRAFRIGQHRDVQVRKLVCVGTVEERIDALIASKRELAELALGAQSWVGDLDTEQLRELLSLGAEAVGT